MAASLVDGFHIQLRTIVLDCADAIALSDFYCALLGWSKTVEAAEWVLVRDPEGGTGLSFQSEPLYERPVWPETPSRQQKMIHLDFFVDNLAKATEHALECGAVPAPPEEQVLPGVAVLLDPAGHPFCLFAE